MQRWLPRVVGRVRELAAARRVRFTLKAIRELDALGAGLGPEDACDILVSLTRADFFRRLASNVTGEWMYIFMPRIGGAMVYIKLILRDDCVVVSFHEDEGALHEQDD